jgi:hypothetical protein
MDEIVDAHSLSVSMAEKDGITLIGYAWRDRFNMYPRSERNGTERDKGRKSSCYFRMNSIYAPVENGI